MTLGIIQARMGSTRFPGKVMEKINGTPLLGLVIQRCRRSKLVDEWIVATTRERRDDVLGEFGVPLFRGPTDNVLARFYLCAMTKGLMSADVVVRVTADDPLKDPGLIDECVSGLLFDTALDYCSNTIPQTYPIGLDVEAFRFRALTEAYLHARTEYDCEHVTPYIYGNPELFACKNLTCPIGGSLNKWRWTIDTPQDLEDIRKMFDIFSRVDPVTVKWDDLVWLIDETKPGADVRNRTDGETARK